MKKHIYSKIFLDIYTDIFLEDKKQKSNVTVKNLHNLEEDLKNYIMNILGKEINYYPQNYFNVIIKYIENIIRNSNSFYIEEIIKGIDSYTKEFKKILDGHPYTKLYINAMNSFYSKKKEERFEFQKNISYKKLIEGTEIVVSHLDNSFTLHRFPKCSEEVSPSISINDIDSFEETLAKYVEKISESDSFYNILSREYFDGMTYEEKVEILFSCTMLNATVYDLLDIEKYFKKYISFITDNSFDNIRQPIYIGNLLEDQLYVMAKRSEVEYETPYYLAFMLKKNHIELPNIRLGIENKENKKVAHIIATQSSQITVDRNILNDIREKIKENIPNDSNFRFYNPSHLISLIITFGLLKGMGINEVEVTDYLPFRKRKSVIEKQMSESEADNFQRRLTDKNIITYMKLSTITNGIEIDNYPEMDMKMKLKIGENVVCVNSWLQQLYDQGYEIGKEYKKEEQNQKKLIK